MASNKRKNGTSETSEVESNTTSNGNGKGAEVTEADDYLRFRLPEALKERFKLYCYLENLTMSDVVREMIEKKLEEIDMDELLQKKLKGERDRKAQKPALSV